MNIGAITRLGNHDPCETLTTGIAPFDTFLSNIDQRLFGSSAVRALTLMEIRSHLVDKREYFLDSGLSEEESIHKAIQSMGDPIDIASSQRACLVKEFKSISLCLGTMYGLFMGGFFGLCAYCVAGFQAGVGYGLFFGLMSGILYGLYMGMLTAFYTPEEQLPSTSINEGGIEGTGNFSVSLSRRNKNQLRLVAIGLLLSGLCFLLVSLISFFFPWFFFPWTSMYPWWISLIVTAGALLGAETVVSNFYECHVCDKGILVARLFYRRDFCEWKNLREVGLWQDIKRFAPFRWKKVWYAVYQTNSGKRRRFLVFPDVKNSQRLIVLLQEKAQANKDRDRTSVNLQA